jgi:hypothetical protein
MTNRPQKTPTAPKWAPSAEQSRRRILALSGTSLAGTGSRPRALPMPTRDQTASPGRRLQSHEATLARRGVIYPAGLPGRPPGPALDPGFEALGDAL